MPTTIDRALIIGCGIAGTAMVSALQDAGVEAVICEAHPRGASGTGSFLTLASNGVEALRMLEADEVLRPAFTTPSIVLRSHTGKLLGRTRTGIELPDGRTSQTIMRSDLYEGMRDHAVGRGAEIRLGLRLTALEEHSSGVTARFADGTELEADVLIGCDGVHSTVRTQIDARAPSPTYSGLLTTGGRAEGVSVDAEPGSYEMIFGRRAFFGYAAAPDGAVWWFANIPQAAEPGGHDLLSSGPALRRRLVDLFARDAGPAVALIDATEAPAPLSAIHTLAHLPRWHAHRSIVIGDAAHAPSPTSGQGASLAIEDALVLTNCLRSRTDPHEAFAAFVAHRRPRVEDIISRAARINSSKAAGPFAAAVRDLLLPWVLKLTADSRSARRQFDFQPNTDS